VAGIEHVRPPVCQGLRRLPGPQGEHPPPAPPLTPLASVAIRPFQQVSVDLITDLPLSLSFDSVMVVVDHGLTKGVIISPCHKSIDAAGVVLQFIFFHIVSIFSHSCDELIFCGDYTPMIGIIACTS
jgi:hypothetical protein